MRTSEGAPVPWELRSSTGTVLAQGTTVVMGPDVASGDSVHFADFSAYQTAGTALRVAVGTSESEPFEISDSVYAALKTDALRFFYYQRASTAITAPYAGGPEWERAAGHGDTAVPCFSGCSYSLDVSKGWYDAGDYGKYVVNGGIAVWTLQNHYERTSRLGTTLGDFGDGTLNIPEGANGTADLLDELRWEMEFMLGMQVPETEAYAGMAHHKVQSDEWASRPILPEDDDLPGSIHPPSTAATLNLAATAAQSARLWAGIDDAFATRCLTAAERAWAAAEANPARYASGTDNDGGGDYSDADVSDEFYWAAAELYIATGDSALADYLRASPHWASMPSEVAPFSWPTTAGLGTVSLAIVPNGLTVAEIAEMRAAIVDAADTFTGLAEGGGYGVPITSFDWGSNSAVSNAGIVMALAHDITGELRFERGATAAMDYLLGRNPLNQSYVTSYRENPFSSVHHRIFANDVDPNFPVAPPGFLAGGPNVNLDGLVTPGALEDCTGMKCWTDDSEAYGLTEVTVNWNAPFAWLACWLDELATAPGTDSLGIDTGFEGYPGSGGAGTGGNGSGGATDPATAGATDPATGGISDPEAGGTTGSGEAGETSVPTGGGEPEAGSSGATGSAGEGNGASGGHDDSDDPAGGGTDPGTGSDGDDDTDDDDGCIEGETQTCTGSGRCEGSQVCSEDGAWSDCDCGEDEAASEGKQSDGCGCRVAGNTERRSRAPATLGLSALLALGLLRRRAPRTGR